MTWDISGEKNWKWDEIPLGAMTLEAGTSAQNYTGGWRVKRPVWNPDKCVNCLQCWVNCPDSCILTQEQKMSGVDYDHCKGCGVCVTSCKFDALHLADEKADSDALTEEDGE